MDGVKIGVVVLIVILGSYALLLSSRSLPAQQETVKNTPITPSPAVHAETDLYFLSPATQVTGGKQTEVKLMIDTHENKVAQVQLELRYNPQELTILSLRPGDYFPQSILLLNEIDEKRGRVNFALTIPENLPEKTGRGELVTLIISRPIDASESSKSSIEFLPKTSVRDRDQSVSLLRSSKGIAVE
jgi:hypothetical protein